MKNCNWIRVSKLSGVALLLVLLVSACKKEKSENVRYSVSGNADGNQEVPAVTTSATGTLSGTYNADSNLLRYTINYSGLSNLITVAHIHGPAAVGVVADPIHNLVVITNGATGVLTGSIEIADSTEKHLMDGKLYYNLHTDANPSGEIRGQITASRN